jgi:hypothetical protein
VSFRSTGSEVAEVIRVESGMRVRFSWPGQAGELSGKATTWETVGEQLHWLVEVNERRFCVPYGYITGAWRES